MSDDHRVSYSHQVGGSNPQPTAPETVAEDTNVDGDLFAFDNCEILDLPDGNVLLVNTSNGSQQTVSRDVSIALAHCKAYRSLRDHAKFLVSYMPELRGEVAGIEQLLTSVRDAGLLTGASELCDSINRDSSSANKLTPPCICIITCDRPAAVERLLESILRGATLSGYKKLYLVDDSRDPANALANQQAVETFNLTSPKNMTYIGETQQQKLLQGLISVLPAQESAIRFLIDREKWSQFKSYGLARTLCLLLSVGDRCIILDDDVLCTAQMSPHRDSGVKFVDGMRDADFYPAPQAWQNGSVAAADPLSGHSKCLGMGLSQALTALGVETLKQQDLIGADSKLLKSLHSDAPVLVTQCGSLGDPGTAGNNWLYHLEPASVNRLLSAPGGLRSALANRQCWLGRSAPAFSRRATMSQVTGLDNSHILPPYFPVFRGEDLIFGHMLAFLYPDSVVLEYDWAVPHLPLDVRKGNVDGDSSLATGNIELALDYISSRRPLDQSVSFQTRLEALILVLLEISEHSHEGILSTFRAELSRIRVGTLRALNDKLRASTGLPQDWVNYLQRCMTENAEVLHAPITLRDISGIPENTDDASITRQIKTFAGEYALALQAWPAIREAAPGIVEQL